MLTRQIKCKKCGAPKEALDDAIVVMCDYCGAYVSVETDQLYEPESLAQRAKEGLRRALNPTRTEKRWQELAEKMRQAGEAGDRKGWRAAAEEFNALQPLVDPSMIPEDKRKGEGLRKWIKDTVAVSELCTFDPAISAAEKRAAGVLSGLYTGADALETARRYIEARTECNRLLQGHPDYPQDMDRPDPTQLARDTLRSALKGMGSMIPSDTLRSIRLELLGEKQGGEGSTCANCGASISPETIESGRCPFCGGRVAVSSDDPQLEALVANFSAVSATIEDDIVLAITAVNMPLAPAMSGGDPPSVETLFRFLKTVLGHLQVAQVKQAVGQLKHLQSSFPKLGPVFDELYEKLKEW